MWRWWLFVPFTFTGGWRVPNPSPGNVGYLRVSRCTTNLETLCLAWLYVVLTMNCTCFMLVYDRIAHNMQPLHLACSKWEKCGSVDDINLNSYDINQWHVPIQKSNFIVTTFKHCSVVHCGIQNIVVTSGMLEFAVVFFNFFFRVVHCVCCLCINQDVSPKWLIPTPWVDK